MKINLQQITRKQSNQGSQQEKPKQAQAAREPNVKKSVQTEMKGSLLKRELSPLSSRPFLSPQPWERYQKRIDQVNMNFKLTKLAKNQGGSRDQSKG